MNNIQIDFVPSRFLSPLQYFLRDEKASERTKERIDQEFEREVLAVQNKEPNIAVAPPEIRACKFASGAKVFVARSSGIESFGTVVSVDAASGIYTVQFALSAEEPEGLQKDVTEDALRSADVASPSRFPLGSRVNVARSDGSRSPAVVRDYDASKGGLYLLELAAAPAAGDEPQYKRAYESMLTEAGEGITLQQ